MKETLKVSLAEFDIEWENPKRNLEFLDELLENHGSELVVLPEMFTTGFSMNAGRIAEKPYGGTYEWMKAKAEEGSCAVCGSVPTLENGRFYNRLYFVTPGDDFIYDKKHLFGYGKETSVYSPGNKIVSAEFSGWKFRLTTCYDLRFPVWCRNSDDYDVLVCVASWPAARAGAWKALLKARAIENMAYTVGVNRTGTDGYDLEYDGNSKIFDAIGEETGRETKNKFLHQAEISKSKLQEYRKKYGFLNDRDEFRII